MLTGVHPFDLYGNASDKEIEQNVLSGNKPPLRKSPLTAHLSKDAIELIERLIEWDPKKRLTAHELLDHPWVRGKTARTSKMADSDKRLNAYRAFRTRMETQALSNMFTWQDSGQSGDIRKKTCMIEHAFHGLDPDLKRIRTGRGGNLSLSEFSDLISDNMKNVYFPKGTVVYREGDKGDVMYFLNSGAIEVYTRDGHHKSERRQGDFFGEGALLHPKKIRSASIRCMTPVHAIEISREYFEKYMASDGGEDAKLDFQEKYKARKRQRAKSFLRLSQELKERVYRKGEYFFQIGEEGNEMYIMEEGNAEIIVKGGHAVETVHPGNLMGEHSMVFGRKRNVSTKCTTDECKVLVLRATDYLTLIDSNPSLKEPIHEICLRREFSKALCSKASRRFPTGDKDLRALFDAIDINNSGVLEPYLIRKVLTDFDPGYKEKDIQDIIDSLEMNADGNLCWSTFYQMFKRRADMEKVH